MTPEFFLALEELARLVRSDAEAGFVVFLRIGAAMALLPAFGEQIISTRVRLALTIAFTAIVAPAILPSIAPASFEPEALVWMIATEVLAGLVIGISLRLFVLALQTAGTIAAQSTSLSQFFGGAGVDPQPAIAQVMMIAGLALAVSADLHTRISQFLIMSYTVMPAGEFLAPGMLAEWGVKRITAAFSLAFTLAMPFVICSLIYNVALGAINKAMPQLMVAFVGAPAITLGGLILLLITAPLALPIWLDTFHVFLVDPTGLVP
jgi:flagellar biosynthetic protein FliR